MTIQWSLFAPGLLLLLFPADQLLSSEVRLQSFDRFQTLENSARLRPWWWVPLLWLDPLRAFLGTMLIHAALALPTHEWVAMPKAAYAVFVTTLAVGVLAQMFTRRDPEAVLAPMGFVAGIIAAATPWSVSAAALALALTAMLALRRFPAFFAVGFAIAGGMSLVLPTGMVWALPALLVFGLPLVVVTVSGRALEIPTRRSEEPRRAA